MDKALREQIASERQAGVDAVQRLLAENRKLRYLLAVRVAGACLYVDDGDMHDATEHPSIDFRRDSADEIERKLMDRGLRRLSDPLAHNG